MKNVIYKIISMIVLATLLAACGPTSAEVAQQATQTAEEVSAIQTKKAPTATTTFTVTPSPAPLPAKICSPTPIHKTTPTGSVIQDIETLIGLGDDYPESLVESIQEGIEENPSAVVEALLPRLSDAKQSERALAIYAWVLGVSKDPAATEGLIKLARETSSEWVSSNCLQALASIGDQKSGEFLVSTLDETTEEDERFSILNLLAQMQYEPALPLMAEILEKDPDEYYWQQFFIFGKMGDKAVPFLLSKLDDENRDVRFSAIGLLGQWLFAPEASQPLRDHYWKEEDQDIRQLILASFQRITPDLGVVKKFSEEVLAKERVELLKNAAQETLDSLPDLQNDIDSFVEAKQISARDFQQECEKLYESAGLEGDYEILERASSPQDEEALKQLRERILLRESDEAFYDYEKISEIIRMNRFMKSEK